MQVSREIKNCNFPFSSKLPINFISTLAFPILVQIGTKLNKSFQSWLFQFHIQTTQEHEFLEWKIVKNKVYWISPKNYLKVVIFGEVFPIKVWKGKWYKKVYRPRTIKRCGEWSFLSLNKCPNRLILQKLIQYLYTIYNLGTQFSLMITKLLNIKLTS